MRWDVLALFSFILASRILTNLGWGTDYITNRKNDGGGGHAPRSRGMPPDSWIRQCTCCQKNSTTQSHEHQQLQQQLWRIHSNVRCDTSAAMYNDWHHRVTWLSKIPAITQRVTAAQFILYFIRYKKKTKSRQSGINTFLIYVALNLLSNCIMTDITGLHDLEIGALTLTKH